MEKQINPSLWRRAEECPTLHPEVSKDCILPDSYPDIHKILYTTAVCTPQRMMLAGGKLQTEGTLSCKVLFSDEEEQLHALQFQLEYDGQIPYTATEDPSLLTAHSTVESITARALNPRKLALRGRVAVTPMLFYRCSDEPRTAPELADVPLEKKLQTVTCWRLSQWREQGIEAGEDLTLSQEPPIGRLIYSDLQLDTTSCTAGEGEVSFSGNGLLHLLYNTPEGALHYTNLSFPFRSSTQGEITSDALCQVKLSPESISVSPTEDAAGEARGVELDFTYSLEVTAAERIACTRPVDCYCVEVPTVTEAETVRLISGLREVNRDYSRNLEGDCEGMTDVLKGFAEVFVDSREMGESGMLLHCTARVTLLGKNGEGAPMSVQLIENFPWEAETGEICFIYFTAVPASVIEGDKVKVRLQGRMSGFAIEDSTFTCVGNVLPAVDGLRSAKDSMTLCYPAPGETLWDIAKRYRTTQSALLSVNTIAEGGLPAVLLIPR